MSEQDEVAKQEPGAGAGKSDRPARDQEKRAVKKEAGDPGNENNSAGKDKGTGSSKESWEFDPYKDKKHEK